MIVRPTERADDSRMLTILGTPAREHHMVKLVAANGERVVRASVRRTARFPRVTTDSPRVETALS
jgi:hypothetical protein